MQTLEKLRHEVDEALSDPQTLEFVHQVIQQIKKSSSVVATETHNKDVQQQAMAAFFGMHKEQSIDAVEADLRLIRQGRRGRFDVI